MSLRVMQVLQTFWMTNGYGNEECIALRIWLTNMGVALASAASTSEQARLPSTLFQNAFSFRLTLLFSLFPPNPLKMLLDLVSGNEGRGICKGIIAVDAWVKEKRYKWDPMRLT